MHLTHLLGKKRNGNQAATGADKEGKERRSARLSPDDIIHGNPARKGAVKGEEELTALPETPLSPLSAQGRKGGGDGTRRGGRRLPFNFATADHLPSPQEQRRAGTGGCGDKPSRGVGARRRLN